MNAEIAVFILLMIMSAMVFVLVSIAIYENCQGLHQTRRRRR